MRHGLSLDEVNKSGMLTMQGGEAAGMRWWSSQTAPSPCFMLTHTHTQSPPTFVSPSLGTTS